MIYSSVVVMVMSSCTLDIAVLMSYRILAVAEMKSDYLDWRLKKSVLRQGGGKI